MLPGFRFLFAAIALSMSVLIFGLGAAALLRAAHEQFASMPSRSGPPEAVFARPVETIPTLALLRVDAPVIETAPDQVATEPAATIEPEKVATLKVENSALPEALKPDIAVTETKPSDEPVQAEPAPATDQTKMAAIPEAPKPEAPKPEASTSEAPASELTKSDVAMSEDLKPEISVPARDAAPVEPDQNRAAVAPDTALAATRIATLGSPTATVEKKTSARTSSAKPDRSAIRKRQQAQRAKERRRRIAARARLARQATQQPIADPFAQATITTRSR